jgi:hypothetical protein
VTTPARVTRPAAPWPAPFGWMPKPIDQLGFRILERARADIGVVETGPNRGPEIDGYLRRAFVPEALITAGKGNWCAAWVGCIWADAGASVPTDFGSCDAWLPYLIPCTLAELATTGREGDAVLFGVAGDARHIEILVRTTPKLLSIGGNRGLKGSATNNGEAVHLDQVTRGDVLGVVRPTFAEVRTHG